MESAVLRRDKIAARRRFHACCLVFFLSIFFFLECFLLDVYMRLLNLFGLYRSDVSDDCQLGILDSCFFACLKLVLVIDWLMTVWNIPFSSVVRL